MKSIIIVGKITIKNKKYRKIRENILIEPDIKVRNNEKK